MYKHDIDIYIIADEMLPPFFDKNLNLTCDHSYKYSGLLPQLKNHYKIFVNLATHYVFTNKLHRTIKYLFVLCNIHQYLTKPIATQIFNYKHVLQDLNIDDFKSKPPDCTCSRSKFTYNLASHVITGDLNIVNNTSLQNVLSKGPKYHEPKTINWK